MRRFKILFILADPDRSRPIDPHGEFRDVLQAIKAGKNRDAIDLSTPVLAARWADVVRAVDDELPDIVHIASHGSTTHLQFVGPDGVQPVAIDAALITDLFRPRRIPLKLVLFNACQTAPLAQLVRDTVGCCAIGADRPITDPQATTFAGTFYGRLSDGESVKQAFERGRTAIGEGRGTHRAMVVDDPDDGPSAHPSFIIHLFDVERSTADELVLTDSEPSSTPFHVPFPKNESFEGRDDDLAELHKILTTGVRAPVGIRPTGLTGMGGIGKTQLAVEYTYRYARHYPQGVFWVNAAPTIQAGFAALGTFLGAAADASRDVQITTAFDALRQWPDSLLVLDNVEDPAVLFDPVAPARLITTLPGAVLFTTRRTSLGGLPGFSVTILPEKPALRLLLRKECRHAIRDNPDHPEYADALEICGKLGWLPLALELAGSLLGLKPSIRLAQYLAALESHGRLTVVDREERRDLTRIHQEAVAATLRSQWDWLTEADDRLVFRVAGQFPEAAVIPVARLGLFAGISDSQETAIFDSPLEMTMKRLDDASLVERLEHNTIRLHPLVCEFAEALTAKTHAASFRRDCAEQLATAYENYPTLEEMALTRGTGPANRGIDAVEADLLAGLSMVTPSDPVHSRLNLLLRLMQRESHNLRDQELLSQPKLFRQQIHSRAMRLGLVKLSNQANDVLSKTPGSHMRLLWSDSRDPPELRRTVSQRSHPITAMEILPSSNRLITGSEDGTIGVWDLLRGVDLTTIEGPGDCVTALAVLPNGIQFVSGTTNGTLKVWNAKTGDVELILQKSGRWITALTVLPTGQVVSGSDDGAVMVWNIRTEECQKIIDYYSGWVTALVVLPDGRLVSAFHDGSVKVWNVDTGEVLKHLDGDDGRVTALVVLPDGRLVTAVQDGSLKVWDAEINQVQKKFDGDGGRVTALMVLPDGQLLSASQDGTASVWNLASGDIVRSLPVHAEGITSVALLPGKTLISASFDGTVRMWDLESSLFEITSEAHLGPVIDLAILPDGRLVTPYHNGTVRTWNLEYGEASPIYGEPRGCVTASVLLASSRRLVSGSDDGALTIWDLECCKVLSIIRGPRGCVNALAASPCGGYFVSATSDGAIRVWNAESGRIEKVLDKHIRERGWQVKVMKFLPEGSLVSASYNGTIRVWNIERGEIVRSFKDSESGVAALDVLPKCGGLVLASYDGAVRVWDLERCKVRSSLEVISGGVASLAVLPGFDCVVTGSYHGALRVWDVQTGQYILSHYLDHSIMLVKVTADGKTLIASDILGSIYAFRLDLCEPQLSP